MINSSALNFTPKPWFKIPEFPKETVLQLKKSRKKQIKAHKILHKLTKLEKILDIPSYEC
jgi:hypothetical protein